MSHLITISISNNMNIATSGLCQLRSTSLKSKKETISSAKTINKTMTWTKTPCSTYLTEYAEGIACNNFDRRHCYTKRMSSNKNWLVCSSHIFEDSYESQLDVSNQHPTKFFRVRTVSIEDDFMHCTCQFHMGWMMPCVHMCTVIDDVNFYEITMFHLRWWKHFRYLYKNSSETSRNASLRLELEKTLKNIRSIHFDSLTGKYKGVPLSGTLFLEHVNKYPNKDVTIDEKLHTMQLIHNMQQQGIPLINGSRKYKVFDVTSQNSLCDQVVVSHVGMGVLHHCVYRITSTE